MIGKIGVLGELQNLCEHGNESVKTHMWPIILGPYFLKKYNLKRKKLKSVA